MHELKRCRAAGAGVSGCPCVRCRRWTLQCKLRCDTPGARRARPGSSTRTPEGTKGTTGRGTGCRGPEVHREASLGGQCTGSSSASSGTRARPGLARLVAHCASRAARCALRTLAQAACRQFASQAAARQEPPSPRWGFQSRSLDFWAWAAELGLAWNEQSRADASPGPREQRSKRQ